MNTILKIVNMVMDKNIPDTISAKEHGDLVILNYKQEVQFNNLWTDIELACRGLIINQKTGEIVARPFDKFFNWGENNRKSEATINTITEKMDGSLGVLYKDCGFKIATRGSFDSEQAIWATEFFSKNYHHVKPFINNEWTLLFEIIYPKNRIVVDYEGMENIVLLAIRNRFNGGYLPWFHVKKFAENHGLSLPNTFDFKSVSEILDLCPKINANSEGWVVEFKDGQRFKFKGEEYKKIHKLLSGLSFKFVLENYQTGTLKEALSIIPDEFKDEVKGWECQIDRTIKETTSAIEKAFGKAPKKDRKEYALWCKSEVPELLPYMFARFDGRDILPIIYKHGF